MDGGLGRRRGDGEDRRGPTPNDNQWARPFIGKSSYKQEQNSQSAFFFFFFFGLFRAILTAYANSQARGGIRAVATCLAIATAMWDPSRIFDLHHS